MKHKLFLLPVFILLTSCAALALTIPNASVRTDFPEQLSGSPEGMNLKSYCGFETSKLINGKIVHTTGYGLSAGYDSNIIKIKNKPRGLYTVYGGYTGAKQRYGDLSIIQNGVLAGISGVIYQKNFYTGLSFSAGAADAISENNKEKTYFTMLNSTASIKSGYNFSLFENKITIQPSLLFAYLFVDTIMSGHSRNFSLNSEIVHSFQIIPALKISGNLPRGYQPYFGISEVWNIMNNSSLTANDLSVGDISIKPYVQFVGGIQKSLDNNFSYYLQSTIRYGGRKGIILSFGLRKQI